MFVATNAPDHRLAMRFADGSFIAHWVECVGAIPTTSQRRKRFKQSTCETVGPGLSCRNLSAMLMGHPFFPPWLSKPRASMLHLGCRKHCTTAYMTMLKRIRRRAILHLNASNVLRWVPCGVLRIAEGQSLRSELRAGDHCYLACAVQEAVMSKHGYSLIEHAKDMTD